MAGYEYQAQKVIADVVVESSVEIRHGPLAVRLELATELLMLALDELVPAQVVDRAIFRRGHEPGARVVRDARDRPPLQRDDERVLRQLLGEADVAQHPNEAGDEPRLLDSPDRVDGAMGIGSRHGFRLDQLDPLVQPGAMRYALSRQDRLPCSARACISAKPAAASCTSAGKSDISCT